MEHPPVSNGGSSFELIEARRKLEDALKEKVPQRKLDLFIEGYDELGGLSLEKTDLVAEECRVTYAEKFLEQLPLIRINEWGLWENYYLALRSKIKPELDKHSLGIQKWDELFPGFLEVGIELAQDSVKANKEVIRLFKKLSTVFDRFVVIGQPPGPHTEEEMAKIAKWQGEMNKYEEGILWLKRRIEELRKEMGG